MKQAAAQRVVFLITKSNWGGAQRYVYDIATRLPEEYSPSVLFGGTGIPGSASGILEAKLREKNIPVSYLPSLGRDVHLLHDIRALSHMVRALRDTRPDIVHLNSSKAGGLGALASRIAGVPNIVFTSHGLAYDEDRSPLLRFAIFLATWCTFALCHTVICISHDTFERARRLPFVGRKVRFVRNGIAPFPLMPRDEARTRLSSLYPTLHKEGVWVGAIAELVRNKGLPYAVEAMRTLPKESSVSFIVIGEGDERARLTKQISDAQLSASFILAGFIQDARDMLSAFDVFALSSVKEGLPYTLLEAGLARLPVVATSIPGIEDIIEHGVTGLLVPPHDAEALSRALARLAGDEALRARLGGALYEKVTAHFSSEAMLHGVLGVYAEYPTRPR